jgi:hypothetical protein
MVRFSKPNLRPEELLHFVELRAFTDAWDNFLGLSDDDLLALQVLIMKQPKAAPIVKGTGGLRKVRFARDGSGKRGGIRVCYVYFEEFGVVLLVHAYAKNRKDDLSAAEKKSIQKLIQEVEVLLKKRKSSD